MQTHMKIRYVVMDISFPSCIKFSCLITSRVNVEQLHIENVMIYLTLIK